MIIVGLVAIAFFVGIAIGSRRRGKPFVEIDLRPPNDRNVIPLPLGMRRAEERRRKRD